MTQLQLARALGLSGPRISQLVGKGMPTKSEGAARAWMQMNIVSRKRPISRSALKDAAKATAIDEGKTDDVEAALPDPTASAATIEEAERYLTEVKEVIKFSKSAAAQLWKAGESDGARRWVATYQSASQRLPIFHAQVQRLKEDHKQTIKVGDARGVYAEILSKIRSMLETLPVRMSSKCNPSDPVLAQAMLEDDVRQIFKVLNTRTI